MKRKEREILNLLRDIEVASQSPLRRSTIDNNTPEDVNVKSNDLVLLESRGLIEEQSEGTPSYWLTGKGMKAIIADDIAEAVKKSEENLNELNNQIGDLEKELNSTKQSIQEMRNSNQLSTIIQTVFSISIISFTYIQSQEVLKSLGVNKVIFILVSIVISSLTIYLIYLIFENLLKPIYSSSVQYIR